MRMINCSKRHIEVLKETMKVCTNLQQHDNSSYSFNGKTPYKYVYNRFTKAYNVLQLPLFLQGVFEGDVKHVFEVNNYQHNDKPHWNPTIKEYNVI